mgnify:FL=1
MPVSDRTKIEWSDATWNPVTGCTEVMHRAGKHRAGRELYHDGRTFDEYPGGAA